jgi:hypothetical protein
MIVYSSTAHAQGGRGFFQHEDSNAPEDSVVISTDDMAIALNLPVGEIYSFDSDGVMTISDAPPPPIAELLHDAKIDKLQQLSAACQAQIYSGFTSSALGAVHTYPARYKDQMNLSASVISSLLPGLPENWTTPFWCMDSDGVWAFVPHTAAQIQQVGLDGKAAIVDALSKNEALSGQVMKATTIESVNLIVW